MFDCLQVLLMPSTAPSIIVFPDVISLLIWWLHFNFCILNCLKYFLDTLSIPPVLSLCPSPVQWSFSLSMQCPSILCNTLLKWFGLFTLHFPLKHSRTMLIHMLLLPQRGQIMIALHVCKVCTQRIAKDSCRKCPPPVLCTSLPQTPPQMQTKVTQVLLNLGGCNMKPKPAKATDLFTSFML